MQAQLNQLLEWHKKFDVPYRFCQPDTIPDNEIALRYNVMSEEIIEWKKEAEISDGSIVNMRNRAKELADILYTVFGTVITEGLQDVIEDVFNEVHNSNMSKLDDDGFSIKRSDGKILKGSNYKEPNLSNIIK